MSLVALICSMCSVVLFLFLELLLLPTPRLMMAPPLFRCAGAAAQAAAVWPGPRAGGAERLPSRCGPVEISCHQAAHPS
jgi:hypothetical protein